MRSRTYACKAKKDDKGEDGKNAEEASRQKGKKGEEVCRRPLLKRLVPRRQPKNKSRGRGRQQTSRRKKLPVSEFGEHL